MHGVERKLEIIRKCDRKMFIICLVFLSTFIRIEEASLNQEELERSFLSEVINERAVDSRTLRKLSQLQLAYLCKRLYETPQFKYLWKIHLNELAYYNGDLELITYQLVTFIDPATIGVGQLLVESMSIHMSPCLGHHRPIRTDFKLDDYNRAFFISPACDWDILYIFRKATLENGEVICVVYDRIPFLKELKNGPALFISPDKIYFDTHLNEVVTIDYDSKHVQEVYFHEIINRPDSYWDPLWSLDIEKLVSICWSIFSEKIFIDEGFSFNVDDMFSQGMLFINIPIKLSNIRHIDFMWKLHPCIGRRTTNPSKVSFDYMISSGRRVNSIFVYIKLDQENEEIAEPLYYVENFNLKNLRPTDRDELKIYDDSNIVPNVDLSLNIY